jgi:hypothetical protein
MQAPGSRFQINCVRALLLLAACAGLGGCTSLTIQSPGNCSNPNGTSTPCNPNLCCTVPSTVEFGAKPSGIQITLNSTDVTTAFTCSVSQAPYTCTTLQLPGLTPSSSDTLSVTTSESCWYCSGGSTSLSATSQFTVGPAPSAGLTCSFSMTASPTFVNLGAKGSTGTTVITVTPASTNFCPSVTLSLSGGIAGVSNLYPTAALNFPLSTTIQKATITFTNNNSGKTPHPSTFTVTGNPPSGYTTSGGAAITTNVDVCVQESNCS